MAVPKKRMSKAKKRNRKTIWKSAAIGQSLRAYSIACSLENFEKKETLKAANLLPDLRSKINKNEKKEVK